MTKFSALLILLLPAPMALAGNWAPVAEEGSLIFAAEQQGAGFEGQFNRFLAEFELDPDDPITTKITAIIDVDSVDSLYDERDEYLRGEEWFHVERWPEARFVTERVQRAPDGGFLANALLTLRDTTQPVAFYFEVERIEDGRLRFAGRTQIKRLDFGVGQGDWTNTEWVGNDVEIRVNLILEPALP